MNTVGGTGTSGNCSAMRAKVANAPHCRQACAVQYSAVTLNGWNRRFTMDLSGVRPRRWKSEVLSIGMARFLSKKSENAIVGEMNSTLAKFLQERRQGSRYENDFDFLEIWL